MLEQPRCGTARVVSESPRGRCVCRGCSRWSELAWDCDEGGVGRPIKKNALVVRARDTANGAFQFDIHFHTKRGRNSSVQKHKEQSMSSALEMRLR